MNHPPRSSPASVRQRLLSHARERKEDFQLILNRFALERLLYRLSQSTHESRFTLKGAMLFALWQETLYRATRDLDLLGSGNSEPEALAQLFRELCGQAVEADGLHFDAASVAAELIREENRYGGVRIKLTAMLENARIPLQVDIGFGDTVTPPPVQMQYPTLLEFPAPLLWAYRRETVVAEKFSAIVLLEMANSRMKDYYDLWVLQSQFEFEGIVLSDAIQATFAGRSLALLNRIPIGLSDAFSEDTQKMLQWNGFLKKNKMLLEVPPFEELVKRLRNFLMPLLQALAQSKPFNSRWQADKGWSEISNE